MANPSRFLLFIISLLFLDEEENNLHDAVISSDEDSSVEILSNVSSQAIMEADLGDLVVNYDDEDSDEDCYDEEEDDLDDEDSDEDCYDEKEDDLDDELIQRSVSKKVKRDRIRKVGKRTSAKVPYTQLKRGCIYGKHGFGIRFRC
ncbi:hypothetical protein AALP_AA3G325300 [Arabis alpina]|uniref:Uncharacterized protein n=1 Tax=Arabis alpina TaxID=50452 RepID=A0A087HD60_ARAAL|nr:hypothetical protein AALP_AA3G325300 [Arabis alpina]